MRTNGKRIRRIMEEKNLTDQMVSRRTGISEKGIRWMKDGSNAEAGAVEAVADSLETKVEDIILPDISGAVENTIEFIRDSSRATVTFSQKRFINRIRELAADHPEECEIIAENPDGSVCAHIPVSWIKIYPKREYSDEQRQQLAERMRNMNQMRK